SIAFTLVRMRLTSRAQSSFSSILTSVLIAAPDNQHALSKRFIATKTCLISGSITYRSTPTIITDRLWGKFAASRLQTAANQLVWFPIGSRSSRWVNFQQRLTSDNTASIVPDVSSDPDFEHLAGAVDDRSHRVVGHANGQGSGFRNAFGYALQMRAAAGQADP